MSLLKKITIYDFAFFFIYLLFSVIMHITMIAKVDYLVTIRPYLFLIFWIIGGFLYPVLLKKVLNKNFNILLEILTVSLIAIVSLFIGFLIYFKSYDWESVLFFKGYLIGCIIITIVFYFLGRIIVRFWIK